MHARSTIAAAMAAMLLPAAAYQAPGGDDGSRTEPKQHATPTSTAATPQPSEDPSKHVSVTVALTGDVLIHDSVWASARRAATRTHSPAEFDFEPLIASLRPVISAADLAICHLETPLAPAGGPYSSYPVFSAPPEVLQGLVSVGYDACSTASNHSMDAGFEGVARTIDDLDRAGLAHTGTSRSPAGARNPVILNVGGIRIGWLSYTFGTNGLPVDADKPWSVNLIDPARILQDARRAQELGADAVLVALHWGDEYSHQPSAFQVSLAQELTRSPDITMIYGHHAHVTQPIVKVNGKWVVYGLGNLLTDQKTTAPGVNDGLVAVVTLSRTGESPARVTGIETAPTHIESLAPPYGELRVTVGGLRA